MAQFAFQQVFVTLSNLDSLLFGVAEFSGCIDSLNVLLENLLECLQRIIYHRNRAVLIVVSATFTLSQLLVLKHSVVFLLSFHSCWAGFVAQSAKKFH